MLGKGFYHADVATAARRHNEVHFSSLKKNVSATRHALDQQVHSTRGTSSASRGMNQSSDRCLETAIATIGISSVSEERKASVFTKKPCGRYNRMAHSLRPLRRHGHRTCRWLPATVRRYRFFSTILKNSTLRSSSWASSRAWRLAALASSTSAAFC